MAVVTSDLAQAVDLPPTPGLTLSDIEAAARGFCADLVRTPENAHRTLWRDLVRSDIPVTYPLALEMICDFREIELVFVPAFRRAMPKPVVDAFDRVAAETGAEPAIYVDRKPREWVLYQPEATNNLTRFFIAAQVGHIVLHARPIAARMGSARFFLTLNPEARSQAAAFARALLMPRTELKAKTKAVIDKLPGRTAAEGSLDHDSAVLLRDKLQHRFAAPGWAIRTRIVEIGYPDLLKSLF